MSPEQRQLAHGLVVTPPSGHRPISKEFFATRFPEALQGECLSVHLLAQASHDRSAEDLQCALIIGHVFCFSPQHESLLCRLAVADWHVSHEDVVSALDKIKVSSDKAVDALYETTQISLPYLEYDSSKALAVKAIWTLGKITGVRAEAKLNALATSDNPIIRKNADQQLKKRRK